MRAQHVIAIVCLATAGGIVPSGAQAPELARDQPGRWVIMDGSNVVKTVAPSDAINVPIKFPAAVATAERPHVQAWVNQLVEIVRHSPVLAQPRGFDVIVHTPEIELRDLDDQTDSQLPALVAATMNIGLSPKEAGGVADDAHTAATIELTVNRPAGVLQGQHAAGFGVTPEDRGVEFFQEPVPPDETRHGLPAYQGARVDQWHVLITRSTAPMFAPVTREQFLRSVIDTVQKQAVRPLASTSMGAPPSNDPAVIAAWQEAQRRMAAVRQTYQDGVGQLQGQLEGLTKQLAAMSPAERSAPAYVWNVGPSESGPVEFLHEGESNALPVVRRNPVLMDARLPRWTPQTLTVTLEGDALWPELAAKLDQELDWKALEKFVGRGSP